MGRQASRRCLCRHSSAFRHRGIYLHPALSRRRRLPARRIERKREAKSEREYSAIFVLEFALRTAAPAIARASGQRKCGAAFPPINFIRDAAREYMLRARRNAGAQTRAETN